ARGNSPQIDAAERDLAAVGERLPQASAGYLPQLDLSAAAGATYEFTDTQEEGLSANTSASLSLTQPLYRGGGTVASVDQAKLEIKAQEETVKEAEQAVLLETASIYLDVWRDRQVLDLIDQTLSLVTTELQSVSRQQSLGAATKTDVSQTETRLSQIEADQIDAEAILTGSRAQFERLIGMKPGDLKPRAFDLAVPPTVDEAVAQALSQNPTLKAAGLARLAAERTIDVISAQYAPSVDLRSALQYFSEDIQESGGQIDDDVAIARLEARVTVPLYRGGGATSRVREAEQIARATERQEEDIRRRITLEARGAWNLMTSAGERIERLQQAVETAGRVVEGTAREQQLGARTTLDLLNARRDLLDLQTALINVRRDQEVAKFELMAAMGQFTSNRLNLPAQ
ncbi:MAG: TolC family outer membrane protein, partial [Geminicoccaceae bacterium]